MNINKKISEFISVDGFDNTTQIPIVQGNPMFNGKITPEKFIQTIADNMLIELNLDNVDNTSDINKPISTATKTYVDNKVKTDVPASAKFTDTIYTHPASHPASMITESTTKRFVTDTEKSTWTNKETPSGAQTKATKALTDAKDYVDGKVKTDVPVGAKFTDTIVDISGKADKTYVDEQTDIINEQIDIINDKHIPIITLTEDEYHFLNTKDPNTFYFIKEE